MGITDTAALNFDSHYKNRTELSNRESKCSKLEGKRVEILRVVMLNIS